MEYHLLQSTSESQPAFAFTPEPAPAAAAAAGAACAARRQPAVRGKCHNARERFFDLQYHHSWVHECESRDVRRLQLVLYGRHGARLVERECARNIDHAAAVGLELRQWRCYDVSFMRWNVLFVL